ncbi:MAG: hypothetical protein RRC34_04325 [Lentisphaeria bacterium]|nr:hypothetical protein [Lentisphaeria bacterium]
MKAFNTHTPPLVVLCSFLIAGFVGSALGNGAVDGTETTIMASPQTIVLAKVDSVTIHTNIPAVDVAPQSVELNGVAPTGLGVDSRGHLVATFALADLALEPGTVTLTLTGLAGMAEPFAASDTVTVK